MEERVEIGAGDEVGAHVSGAVEEIAQHDFGGDNGFVHIHLPIHEAARDDELFDAVDAFFVDDELVVFDVEHIDDTVGADDALAHASEVAVAAEVVEPVHIELARDELVEEMLGVLVSEDGNGGVELAVQLLVEAFEKDVGDGFVVDVNDGVFQYV